MTAWPTSHGRSTGPNQTASTANSATLISHALSTSLRSDQRARPRRASRLASSRQAERVLPVTERTAKA